MYDMKGFGERIADLRKGRGMTQEDLAEQLGITSQAVSKWENNLSYPDITIIPTICAIFNISLDDIFGKIKKDVSNLSFPPVFKGLNVVATFANMACYSDKEKIQEGVQGQPASSTVNFKDGSIAELQSRRIVNKGAGRIIIKALDESFVGEDSRSDNIFKRLIGKDREELTSVKFEYGDIMELECSIPNANCEIIKADGDVTSVYAEGYTELIDLLEFNYDGVVLKLDYDHKKWDNINHGKWDSNKNNIKISLASKLESLHKINLVINGSGTIDLKVPGDNFDATINGSGDICAEGLNFGGTNVTINGSGDIIFGNAGGVNACVNGSGDIEFGNAGGVNVGVNGSGDIKFGNAGGVNASVNGSGDIEFGNAGGVNISVNGSGNIKLDNAGEVDASVNGSGDIELKKCEGLKIDINGSGDFDIDEVTASVDASIRGSGDISIKRGEVANFEIYIENSGEINAAGVTAKRAKIEMPGNGRVELGRVIQESIEICSDDAELIIHRRG